MFAVGVAGVTMVSSSTTISDRFLSRFFRNFFFRSMAEAVVVVAAAAAAAGLKGRRWETADWSGWKFTSNSSALSQPDKDPVEEEDVSPSSDSSLDLPTKAL